MVENEKTDNSQKALHFDCHIKYFQMKKENIFEDMKNLLN